jgi:hypothetical protein
MAAILVPILIEAGASALMAEVISFAITMVASSIVSKIFASDPPPQQNGTSNLNTGTNLQVSPATNNKLPVVYGTTYIGGTITDLSITSNNQDLYYVLSICEVTGGSSPDTISFGDIYYGGKLCIFDGTDLTKVVGLKDQSTGTVDSSVSGHLYIYLYNNGSNSPVNSGQSAISVMQSSGLTYTWDNTKLMSNCAFAIVHLNYNQNANITSIQQTQFEVINPRNNTGDVLYDYLTNTRYGAAIPVSQIDTASLTALTTYSNQTITFNNYNGVPTTQPRFKFNGFIDTTQTVLQNLQTMTDCCDCLLKYNEIYGIWSVVVQSPSYTVVMDINDSNMISTININTLDISNTYNIAQCQFPDLSMNSNFNTTQIDLATAAPALLYPNEPVNLQSIKLNLVNNDVQAQLLGTRFLKAARLDLQVTCSVNYIGLELEAGDIVTVTNANYGWVAKLFRVTKVVQKFGSDGAITVDLTLQNYDPTVYNDASVTQFTPPPNTGLPSPNIFGTIPAPTVSNSNVYAPVPYFQVNVTTSSAGITQYAEVWYSAFATPSMSQMIFAGTTEIQSNGTPYGNGVATPPVTLTGFPAGSWYFFTRMVNAVATSLFSPASSVFSWKPFTLQFSNRYLSVAYATSATGTGFSSSPRGGKTYFGLLNSNVSSFDPTPIDYTWYPALIAFGTDNYLLFSNRTNQLMSFSVGTANYSAGTAQFVPSDITLYDPTIWNALPDGYNVIDLTLRTGQLIQTGTTTVGTGEIAITNNPQGQVIASLAQLLTFPGGAYTKTASAATLTIDIYGRVVGFAAPDSFYYTMTAFSASSGQTVFTVTRGSEYVVGNCWVFRNGLLLDTTEYTDASGSVTLGTGAIASDIITIISFASVNSSSVTYNSFSRNTVTLTDQATYTASGFTLVSGNELLFLNGTVVNAQDYNISGQDITFATAVSGDMQVIQWANNNLGVPNGTPVNVDIYTTVGQATYPFAFDPNAFNLWNNGALLLETVDYSVTTGYYTLAQTPLVNLNILVQQTFNRTGAV